MSGVCNDVFRELGYIIGEAWILKPNDIVLENYDLAFDSKSDEIISMEQLKQQMIEKDLLQFDEIVLLAGKKHKKVVTQLYPEEIITYPLAGCKGIGYMLQRLKGAVGKVRNYNRKLISVSIV